jgi:hypothetical protein
MRQTWEEGVPNVPTGDGVEWNRAKFLAKGKETLRNSEIFPHH